jgi:hypothetical protein
MDERKPYEYFANTEKPQIRIIALGRYRNTPAGLEHVFCGNDNERCPGYVGVDDNLNF